MTPQEYQQLLESQQTAQLRQLLESSPSTLDRATVLMDPKFRQQMTPPGQVPPPLQGDPLQPSMEPPMGAQAQGFGLQPSPAPQQAMDWMAGPEQGGLGIASPRGTQGPPMTPVQAIASEIFPPGTELGFMDRWNLNSAMPQIAVQMMGQRRNLALQLAQLEETKRQNQWEDVFKVLGNEKLSPPQQIQMLKKMGESNPAAGQAAHTVNERLLGRFRANIEYLPQPLEVYKQGLVDGKMSWESIAADIDAAEEIGKLVRKENSSTAALAKLEQMAKDNPNDTAVQMALAAKQAELQKKKLEYDILQASSPALKEKPAAELANTRADTVLKGAPKEVFSGVSSPSGEVTTGIFNPKTQQVTELKGTPLQRTQDISATGLEKMIDERAALQQMATLDKLYKDQYVGQFDNIRAWAQETAPGVFGPIQGDEERFRKGFNQVMTATRRIDVGTAQSVAELENLAKSYPDLSQHESVFSPAWEAMRERTRSRLEARSRLVAEIAAGKQKPIALSERAAQLATLVSAPGFAKSKEEARSIAQDILKEEMKLGIVKVD